MQLALTEPEFIARDAELQDRRRVYGLVGATAVGLSALSLGIALLVASRSETPHVPGLEGPLMMMLGSGLVALVAFIGVGVVGGRRRHLQGVSVEESLTVSSASPVGWAVSF
ncbi:MAG: hypothetical protein R3B40_29605 [Polyangiales bacterium]|nr:hypothetical protein [Sandaracinaceae bacterium]